jgi:hypothetical protein
MSAIITDQLRILNASNFVSKVTNSDDNSYYAFIGLPNATEYSADWDVVPPAPKDSFDQENDYWDTMVGLSKILPQDTSQVVKKNEWESGSIYDMYRHDITSSNISPQSGATSLYSSNYYVINEDLNVYICLDNGASPENDFKGNQSLDEPTFTALEPRTAGNSGDGYIWKYLYTIKPRDLVKFESVFYMPTPKNWATNTDTQAVKNHASSSGQLKIAKIRNRGVGVTFTSGNTITDVPIKGDGSGAFATVILNNDQKVESVIISKGGSGYTYGTLDLASRGVSIQDTSPVFDVIIPPKGGHGFDVYNELGASNVLLYTRIENTTENPDFITGNQISRFGIVQNPLKYSSSEILDDSTVSSLYALKLKSLDTQPTDFYKEVTIEVDSFFTQTLDTNVTAVGRVISYDKNTGVLKYWQDRRLVGFNTDGSKNSSPSYGFNLERFTATPTSNGSAEINFDNSVDLQIDTNFDGSTETINNNTYQLGQSFIKGVSNPEVEKYSGNIIYVDNRPSITRSSNQKEDIKVILQF